VILIDYCSEDRTFEIEFSKERYIEREEYEPYIILFKRLYIKYNPSTRVWSFPENKVLEFAGWFDKEKLGYDFTKSAGEKIVEIGAYSRELSVFRGRTFDSSVINKHNNIKMFNFQVDVINWLLKRNVALNALDSGLGKTFITIAVLSQLYKLGEIDGIIISVPINLEYNFQEQILLFSAMFKEEDIQFITNENKNQPFSKYKDKKIIIVSHHLLKDIVLSYKKNFKFGSTAKNIRWNRENICNIEQEWGKNKLALVIDESHQFADPDAIKTKVAFYIKKHFKYIYELSATPNIGAFEKIYSQVTLLDHSTIPMPYKAFLVWIAKDIGNRYGMYNINEYNADNVAQVRSTLKNYVVQLLKKDCPEMKAKKLPLQVVYLKMTDLQKQIYKLVIEEQFKKMYEEHDKITWKLVEEKFAYMIRALDCPEYLQAQVTDNPSSWSNIKLLSEALNKWSIEDNPKVKALDSMLEDIIEYKKEKVIIADPSPFALDLLFKRYAKYKPLIIHGSLEDEKYAKEERHAKVVKFNTDPQYKIFLLSTRTSAEGLNLQSMCRRLIFFTLPEALKFWQMQDRTCRINSEDDTYIYYFKYSKTIDERRIYKTLNKVKLAEHLDKDLSQSDLENLLQGVISGDDEVLLNKNKLF
jgi:SNF2 family DNA or RNA helicase